MQVLVCGGIFHERGAPGRVAPPHLRSPFVRFQVGRSRCGLLGRRVSAVGNRGEGGARYGLDPSRWSVGFSRSDRCGSGSAAMLIQLDDPALVDDLCAHYLRSGFTAIHRQIEVAPDPRLQGLLAPTAAPHVPIIR